MSTTDFSANPDNFCYRHPQRQSFVMCQRCLRTICTECQTPMPVGVICPECLAEQHKAAKATNTARARRRPTFMRSADTSPRVTLFVLAAMGIVFALGLFPGIGNFLYQWLAFTPRLLYPEYSGTFQPWRLVSVVFIHGGFLHVALNAAALWMIGRVLEPMLGHARFLALFMLSAIGGSVAVSLLNFTSIVVGASGAVFGLFGAMLVIGRHLNADIRFIAIVIGLNLVLPFLPFPGSERISWQAHIGGLAVGALVGFIYTRTSRAEQRTAQRLLLGATTLGLLGLLLVPPAIYG